LAFFGNFGISGNVTKCPTAAAFLVEETAIYGRENGSSNIPFLAPQARAQRSGARRILFLS